MDAGSSTAWLRAFIALEMGNVPEARESLCAYLGRALLEDERCTKNFLLQRWDEDAQQIGKSHPAYYFPHLPPRLTGFQETVTRMEHGPPVLPRLKSNAEAAAVMAGGGASTHSAGIRKQVLAVATEWSSHHGGLSTFNREFCIAISRAGHRVACLVPSASPSDVAEAKTANVELIVALPEAGLDEQARLCSKPPLPADFVPDILIGHDRITGPAAKVLKHSFFPDALRIQFIHTAPGEIEWFKDTAVPQGAAARAEERERIQLELALTADLVIAVGPRLYDEFATSLGGRSQHPPIDRLDPGLGAFGSERELLPRVQVLVLGRAEDERLKGLDIAARAMGLSTTSLKKIEPILVVRGAVQGTGDDLRNRLLGYAQSPGLDVRVKEYTTDTTRLLEDLNRASLLLMPSRKEGFGLVGIEAIAAGTPILVSKQSGLAALIRDTVGDNNFVVPVNDDLDTDAKKWADMINFVLRDRAASFRRAQELRGQLKKVLSWERAVDTFFSSIQKL